MYENEELAFNGIVEQIQNNDNKLNCYILGKSTNSMEHLAYRVINHLEECCERIFTGIVKHFSIEMPYFDTREGAIKFMDSLRNSISIARDCYDEYRGIVLLECSDEWGKYGINHAIINIMDYLRSLENIQFIVIETVRHEKHTLLFRAFSLIGIWAIVEYSDLNIDQCVELGIDKLHKIGFEVTDNGRQLLHSYLKDRDDLIINNEVAITQWIHQLEVNRGKTKKNGSKISIKEIELLPGVYKKDTKKNIGFER